MDKFYTPVSQIKLVMQSRGVALAQPVRQDSITNLRQIFPMISNDFFEIFREFDGFLPGQTDGASVIAVWGVDQIASYAKSSNIYPKDRIAFGDFMIGSENICCSASNLENPVFLDESLYHLADSYFDFWYKICSGTLDFN